MLSIATERNLGDLYVEAVRKYISECKPDRLKAFAAPGAGKRIRVNIDHELYYALIKKNGNSCVNTKDVVHLELEYYLDHTLKAIAAYRPWIRAQA